MTPIAHRTTYLEEYNGHARASAFSASPSLQASANLHPFNNASGDWRCFGVGDLSLCMVACCDSVGR